MVQKFLKLFEWTERKFWLSPACEKIPVKGEHFHVAVNIMGMAWYNALLKLGSVDTADTMLATVEAVLRKGYVRINITQTALYADFEVKPSNAQMRELRAWAIETGVTLLNGKGKRL